ncbi:hypothetical protein RvY_14480 [Ramazzottius varieornatus]|uniref:F-box domain-containing protein n=1 Tax=Ramazzottius varieornatus TaxID=947166 RepID=A0A1D1VYT9_RAMVA|nr:hypothetical protein RvY_14480 [Ramazzottius varieornatus]
MRVNTEMDGYLANAQRTFELGDLPDELMLEIFIELEIHHQHRLRRVSKEWMEELSSIRLQKVVRMDIFVPVSAFDTDYKFTTFSDLKSNVIAVRRPPSESGVRYTAHYQQLSKAVTPRTKVLQLNWIEPTENYNLSQSMASWYVIWSFVVLQRDVRPNGVNLTHILLDNMTAFEGLHNLSNLFQRRDDAEAMRRHPRSNPLPPKPVSAIAFRRCRFELIGLFVSFFRNPFAYQDCDFKLLPEDCSSWVRIPLRVLRPDTSARELEENLLQDLEHLVGDFDPSIVGTLTAKSNSLPEDAKLRWKKELKRNGTHYSSSKIDDIDLETVEWKNLRPSSLLFFLSFKNIIVSV